MTQSFAHSLVGVAMLAALALTDMPLAQGQSTASPSAPVLIPDSPAGRTLRAFLNALNSGDSAAMEAYSKTYQPNVPARSHLQFRSATGGLNLLDVRGSAPLHIEFLASGRTNGMSFRGKIDVGTGDPAMVTKFQILAIPEGASIGLCTTDGAPSATTPVVADPKDVASLDAIIAANYEAISGPACQRRNWDRFRSLFIAGARLFPTGVGPGAKARIGTLTPDEYAAGTGMSLEENGFEEHEIARTTETFGSVTQIFSTYESRWKATDQKPFARGINSIQLFNDGTRWWIVTVFWGGERPDNPIPQRYLNKPER